MTLAGRPALEDGSLATRAHDRNGWWIGPPPVRRGRGRGRTPLVLAVALFAFAPEAAAQKETFGDALIELARALEGTFGDEQPRIDAALGAMGEALGRWDARILEFETSIAAEAASGSPSFIAQLRTALAARYLERGRVVDALRELETATDLDAGLVTAHLLRGLIHDVGGDAAAAREAFATAWEAAPGDEVAAYFAVRSAPRSSSPQELHPAARVLVAAHERSLAEPASTRRVPFIETALVDEARTERPMFLPSGYKAAFELVSQRRYDEALATLRQLVSDDPLHADRALRLETVRQGLAAFRHGQPAAALPPLETAVARTADSSELHRVLGNAYRSEQQHEKAVAQLEQALHLDPRNERAFLGLAATLMEMGLSAEAESVLQRGATALPDSGQLHWALARHYSASAREPEMVRSLDAVLEAGALTGKSAILSSIGRLRLRNLEFDLAEAAFERNADVNPNSAMTHLDLGEFYRSQNQPQLATAEFVAALLITPGSVHAHTSMGHLHLEAGRYEAAVAALQRALALEPDLRDAQYALASALLRLGRRDEGEQALARFREIQARETESLRLSHQVATLTLDARLRESEGKLAQAAEIWTRVVALQPNATHHLNLAAVLVQIDRLEPAVQQLEEAAALGAHPAIYRRIAELYDALGRPDDSARARQQYDRQQAQILRTQGVGR